VPPSDPALLAAALPAPQTYQQVVTRLKAIDAALGATDGLRWFNRLYLAMTEAVAEAARAGRFRDPLFLERLDCLFADLYFQALAAGLTAADRAPGAWKPLFACRSRSDLAPVQLALAGVNAHINRDLPVALVAAYLALGGEPDDDSDRGLDYLAINAILESVQVEAKQWLITGPLADLDRKFGRVDDVLQIWSLSRARDSAWICANVRWFLRPSDFLSRRHLESLDRTVGFAGRGLLRPLPLLNR
jgi:hypothetical protein